MALKALVAGQEVRQYLEFLQSEESKEQSKNDSANPSQQTGWLPSPDSEVTESNVAGGVSADAWQAFVKQQDEKLAQIASELKAEQTEALTRLMNQLSSTLQAQKPAPSTPPPRPVQSEYSEIIEDKK